ncbi:MAG: bacterial transcriptional activator domain-containing protein [Roseovarius sp.]
MIHISVLGRLSVCGNTGHYADIQTKRGEELLAFLFLEADRSFHRSQIAESFWPHLPEDRGRKALNTELWRVCRSLEAVGIDVAAAFHRTPSEIGYNRQPDHLIDVDRLETAMQVINSILPEDAGNAELRQVRKAIEAYTGDLLESVYSDWCLLWRESLRAQHIAALEYMLKASMVRQEWHNVLTFGRELLALDPLMENVHREMMRCHYHNGNRPLALRQYALCEQLLREELGVGPMDETQRIQQTILAVNPAVPLAQLQKIREGSIPKPLGRRSPAQKVDLALSNINSARNWLESVSQELRAPPSGHTLDQGPGQGPEKL